MKLSRLCCKNLICIEKKQETENARAETKLINFRVKSFFLCHCVFSPISTFMKHSKKCICLYKVADWINTSRANIHHELCFPQHDMPGKTFLVDVTSSAYNVKSQETKIFTSGKTWKVSFTKRQIKWKILKFEEERRGKRKYLLSSWTFSRHAEITTRDMSLTANFATLCKIRLRKYQRNISSSRKF